MGVTPYATERGWAGVRSGRGQPAVLAAAGVGADATGAERFE